MNRKQIIGLISICLVAFLAGLDFTAVNLALVDIGHYFNASLKNIAWVNNFYLLSNALFIIPAGLLADKLGRRYFFILGVLVFTISSLCSAISPALNYLLIARFAQGLGAAMMYPASLGLLMQNFPVEYKSRVMGYFSGSVGLSMALGPTIGGLLLNYINWQAIFLINIPISVLVLLLAFLVFSKDRKKNFTRFDYALMKNKQFVFSTINRLIINYIFYAFLFVLGVFLQNKLHLSALQASSFFLFITITYAIGAPLCGRWMDLFDIRFFLIMGLTCFFVSLLVIALYESINFLYIPLIIFGLGMSVVWPATSLTAIRAVAPQNVSLATGIIYMFSYIGGTVGIEFSTILLKQTHSFSLVLSSFALIALFAMFIVYFKLKPQKVQQEVFSHGY